MNHETLRTLSSPNAAKIKLDLNMGPQSPSLMKKHEEFQTEEGPVKMREFVGVKAGDENDG